MTRIRPARSSDVPAVRSLHAAAIEAFGPEAYDDEAVAAWATSEEDDHPLDGLDDPDVYGVVAERAGELAGFGRLDVDNAEVTGVYVHPDHAREGVGSALLSNLEGYARGVGLSNVRLWASLNAVGFYERAGYEQVRETTDGVELDCIVMGKVL